MRSNRNEDLLFRDYHEFGKIRKIRDQKIRDQSPFFREHQFLRILASRPYFEYPSLAKTSETTLLFLSIQ